MRVCSRQLALAACLLVQPVFAATFSVTTTADSGAGSLRQAILDANATTGSHSIVFAIPGTGPHTLAPNTELPAVQRTVLIDGFTQPGASPNSSSIGNNAIYRIQLSGQNLPGGSNGLFLSGAGSTLRGLVVNRFANVQVVLANGDGSRVEGCHIGTTLDGSAGFAGQRLGLFVASNGNTIGGSSLSQRNLVSGFHTASTESGGIQIRGHDNLVLNTYVGTDAAGGSAIPNRQGIWLHVGASRNRIGHSNVSRANLISGNAVAGILLTSTSIGTPTDNDIFGNIIGLAAFPIAAIPNASGIRIEGSTSGTFVGLPGETGNTIGGNSGAGIRLLGGSGTAVFGNTIANNGGLGIDLGAEGVSPNDPGDIDDGANAQQNFPVLEQALVVDAGLRIRGQLDGQAGESYILQFYSNAACDPSGHGEGGSYLDLRLLSGGSAPVPFDVVLGTAVEPGRWITATATSSSASTSEFSPCVLAELDPSLFADGFESP